MPRRRDPRYTTDDHTRMRVGRARLAAEFQRLTPAQRTRHATQYRVRLADHAESPQALTVAWETLFVPQLPA